MALTIGSQLGSHEITALLGKGGMGEVYRARDLKLKREVAIKILPEEFARDGDRLLRFQREAELLASLNHPNIAAIYDVGQDGPSRFIVLELVEGETLAERLERSPIPLDEALRIASSICEALEAAHEKGIVHRDLKPANVKLTPDGRVKVLDFGLAKTDERASGNSALSNSPTLMTMAATNAGVILGTAAYMSPEQARGAVVDKRSDIWAFGVVLYEMLTGQSPFTAPTLSDTLALVLTKDTDVTAVPERVRPLLRRCLERDVRKRLRDIGDAAILLEATPTTPVTVTREKPSKRLSIILGSIALVSTIAASVFAFLHLNEAKEAARLVQFQIPVQGVLRPASLSVSPDGRYVSFQVQESSGGGVTTRIRTLDSLETRTLLDVSSSRLAWSRDSKSALFFSERKLKRIDVGGGPIETVFEPNSSMGPGAPLAQTSSDKWLYRLRSGEILEIPPTGGAPARLLPAITGLLDVHFLPDEKHFLYSGGDASVPGTTLGIFTGSIDTAETLASQWKSAQPFATTDASLFSTVASPDKRQTYVLFMRDGAVVAQSLDNDKLQASGPAVTVATNLSDFAVSRDVLAYRSGRDAGATSQLQWFDRRGSKLRALGEPNALGDILLSRDGKTVMIDRIDSSASAVRVWLGDTARGVFTRLTSANANETAGALTPDGGAVLTMNGPGTLGDLYIVRPNNATPELLTASERLKHPNDVSPDGKYLIYDEHGRQAQDLWILPLNAGATAKPIPFLVTAADETFAQFSPDGKWVAYMSRESGRPEVYVRAFLPDQNPAAGGRKWIVSTAGGDKPRWSRDGRELFYLAPNGKLMATPVKTGETFEPGIPVALFDAQFTGYFPYDVSPDGGFLINTPLTSDQATASSINVIVNWSSILKKQD